MSGDILVVRKSVDRERIIRAVIVGIFVGALGILPLFISSASSRFYLPFLVVIVGLVIVLFTDFAVLLLPVLLFLHRGINVFFPSELWAIFVAIIVLVFHLKNADFRKAPPVVMALLLFVVSWLPSMFNSSTIQFSLLSSLHLVAMLASAWLVIRTLSNEKRIRIGLKVFVAMNIVNTISVVATLSDAERTFGFSGIMFVDYAGIGMVISGCFLFFANGWSRYAWIAIFIIQFIGLFLTQTRNPFLVLVAVSGVMILLAFVYNVKFGLSRKRIVLVSLLAIVFIGAGGALLVSKSKAMSSRIDSASFKSMKVSGESSLGANSILTRILIWDTAINAFKAHPVIGIGMYSFPRSSQHYYTISDVLYSLFVEGLSPHVGYLMVLCEGGILALIGLGIFFLVWLRSNLKSVALAADRRSLAIPVISSGITLYLIFSMAVTDCWLYGQGALLLGLAIGLTGATKNLIEERNNDAGRIGMPIS